MTNMVSPSAGQREQTHPRDSWQPRHVLQPRRDFLVMQKSNTLALLVDIGCHIVFIFNLSPPCQTMARRVAFGNNANLAVGAYGLTRVGQYHGAFPLRLSFCEKC